MCLIIYYRQKSKDNSMIELQDENIAIVTAKTKDFSRYDNTSLKCIRRNLKIKFNNNHTFFLSLYNIGRNL